MAESTEARTVFNEVASCPKGTEVAVASNTAFESVKNGLHNIKVSKHDATKFEREIEGELFDKWHEGCEVMKAKKIRVDNITAYLDHMQDAYEGITPDIRKKMNGILFADEQWEYKIVEWKFTQSADSGARYGMMAFGKSPDGQYVDCMYVLYKMDFKVSPKVIVTKKKHSVLWGLFSWTDIEVHKEERNLGTKSIKAMQNFFRMKALEGFYKEGLIEAISYVDSLDEIPSVKQ